MIRINKRYDFVNLLDKDNNDPIQQAHVIVAGFYYILDMFGIGKASLDFRKNRHRNLSAPSILADIYKEYIIGLNNNELKTFNSYVLAIKNLHDDEYTVFKNTNDYVLTDLPVDELATKYDAYSAIRLMYRDMDYEAIEFFYRLISTQFMWVSGFKN